MKYISWLTVVLSILLAGTLVAMCFVVVRYGIFNNFKEKQHGEKASNKSAK